MKKLATFLTILLLSGYVSAIGSSLTGNPITSDANTVLLDHFDGSTAGTIHGTAKYVPSVNGLNQAIDLSSVGNYITYSKTGSLETKGTVEMWVNPKHYSKGLLNMNWNNTTSYPPNGHIFHLVLDSLGKVSLSNWGWSVNNLFHGNTIVPLNTWTHIAVSWGDSTKIYINGKLDMVSALGFRPATQNTTYFYLSYWGDSTACYDELHISNIQRTNAEIASRVSGGTQDKVYTVTPGNLTNVLTTTEKNTLTTLRLSGTIDARDFKTMRDMPLLATLDLSLVNIVAYSGIDGPRTVDTYYPANTIPRNAFFLSTEKSSLTTVIHPASLTGIGRSAYNLCSGLVNVNLPPSLNTIGYAAFLNCRSLKSVDIPYGVTVIDTFTFNNCNSLTTITIPNTVKEIRYGAFLNCSVLNSPIFQTGSQLTHIGVYAFGVCPKITSFEVPATVSFIGNVAFLGTGVVLDVPADNAYFATINGVLYDKGLTRLMYCPAMITGRVDIPQTVTSIATDAFYNCIGLDSITMPSTLQIIEDWAFENCIGLKTIVIPSTVNQIWSEAFYNCNGLKAIYVNTPAPVDISQSDSVFNHINLNTCKLYILVGLKAQYQAANKWKDFANIVEVSDAINVTPGLLNSYFNDTQKSLLKRLNLAGSIDARDFKTMRDNMPLLEYLDLSKVNIVAYIGTDGTVNSGMQVYTANSLPKYGFLNRTNLKTIFLPSSLKRIEYGAFIRTGLTDVTIPSGVKVLGDYAFQSLDQLAHVSLPASVDSIGYCTFTFNKYMKAFDVDGANTSFSALDGVLFDKTHKILVSYPNLKGNCYKVPDGVEVIDTAAFEACWNLYSVELPTSLKRICLEAFYECNSLNFIEIPASVTALEAYAFYDCTNMCLLSSKMPVPPDVSYSVGVFANINRTNCILRVPAGSKAAYQAAVRWNNFTTVAEDLERQVTISAGGLFNSMSSNELSLVTKLKISGTMDARDFKTMREFMPMLAEVDLSSVTIVAYNGSDGTESGNYQYTANAIPPNAFAFVDYSKTKQWLTKVTFPTSVTSIGYNSFTNTGLKSLTLHEGITRVEDWAFYNCKLNTIAIPATLTEMRDCAFGSNHALTAFTVASGNPNFKTIDGALYDKSGQTLIYYPNAKSNGAQVPEGTQTIQKYAFEGCDFITWVAIPSTVTTIAQPAFNWAGNMNWLEVSTSNPNYCSFDGVIFDKSMNTLVAYPNQKGGYYDIPTSVNTIGPSAFGACWNLTGVNIPMSVSKISNNAFYCSGLTNLYLPTSLNTIEYEAFSNCANLKSIDVYWNYPLDLSNSANVFMGVDKSACVLKVPQNCSFNYRIANQWGEFSYIDEVQNMTYRVKVPVGTKACYLAGEMNGWTQQAMNKENDLIYSITLFAHKSDMYKYCSGPAWMYEELDAKGNIIDNRSYSNLDTVRTWRNVYQPWTPYTPWKIQTSPSYSVGKIQFVSPMEGWVASGSDNSLLHSIDGGETWNKVVPFADDRAGNFSDPAITMDWLNATHGWAMKTMSANPNYLFGTPNGAVLYSTANGGSNWSRRAFPKTRPTIAYSDSDFLGAWQIHEVIEANYSNPSGLFSGWSHTKMNVGTDGNVTFSDNVLSSGTWQQTVQQYELLQDGTFSMTGTDLNGFLNADKKTGFLTMTNEIGCHVFGVMQKQVPGTVYTTSDLQGTWQMHILSVGNPSTQSMGNSGWMYAIASIDASGNAQLNMISSNGDINSVNVQFSITADGFVSMTGMDWHGYMNADKTAFYSTFTDDGGKAYDLCVMQKQVLGNTYSMSDLEGVWRVHEIVLADANSFNNGARLGLSSLNVQKDGSGKVTNSDKNDENNSDNTVQLSISANGVVTADSMVAHGYMNAQKNAIVFATSEGQNASMLVMQKDSTYSGDMGLQVQFADENNGWASCYNWVTTEFDFYRTTNGGTDWNLISNKGMVGFFDFVDASNGWALVVPSDTARTPSWGITHTTDGGLTWSKQYWELANDNQSLNALQFTDLNHGWVTGDNGMLLKTEDGGAHWTSVTSTGLGQGSNCKSLYFLDANTGWLAGKLNGENSLVILKTTDGGASWSEQNTNLTKGSLFSIYYWDENHGWFTGETLDETSENGNYVGIIGRLEDGAIKLNNPTSNNELVLYPNPVKDGFHIRSLEAGTLVSIYQLNGALVLKQRAEGDAYFDVKDLKKGMYLIRIANSKGVVNKKMVKM